MESRNWKVDGAHVVLNAVPVMEQRASQDRYEEYALVTCRQKLIH